MLTTIILPLAVPSSNVVHDPSLFLCVSPFLPTALHPDRKGMLPSHIHYRMSNEGTQVSLFCHCIYLLAYHFPKGSDWLWPSWPFEKPRSSSCIPGLGDWTVRNHEIVIFTVIVLGLSPRLPVMHLIFFAGCVFNDCPDSPWRDGQPYTLIKNVQNNYEVTNISKSYQTGKNKTLNP